MANEQTESECMETLKKEIAKKMLETGLIRDNTLADVVWALSFGPKTLALLQTWVTEVGSEVTTP